MGGGVKGLELMHASIRCMGWPSVATEIRMKLTPHKRLLLSFVLVHAVITTH